jgi:hypothetical protein
MLPVEAIPLKYPLAVLFPLPENESGRDNQLLKPVLTVLMLFGSLRDALLRRSSFMVSSFQKRESQE